MSDNSLENYEAEYVEPAVKDANETYNCKDPVAVIFNNIKFEGGEKYRVGADKDTKPLKDTFKRLGFKIYNDDEKKIINQRKDDIFNTLDEVPVKHDFIAVCICSHGKQNEILASDTVYPIAELLKRVNDKFENRPKLFIIQACRDDGKEQLFTLTSIPEIKDTIIFNSTYQNEAAERDLGLGTHFIQVLCKRLDTMKEENLILDEFIFYKTRCITYIEETNSRCNTQFNQTFIYRAKKGSK